MSIEILIRDITPLYNSYQKGRGILSPTEHLSLMWEIGAALQRYIEFNKVSPHTLFREIYGKSEGTNNVKQRSYIAREFLGRSYRVKRIFATKEEINRQLPGLSASNHFREAMPFFDNPKYVLPENEKQELLQVMNGTLPNKEKERYIQRLQSKRIGIKNPRTQQLDRLDENKLVFVKFYNEIFKGLKRGDFEIAKKELALPAPKFIKILSLNCGAISADGLLMEKFALPKNLDPRWEEFASAISSLIADENPKDRRRFRRLIPAERMVRLSEMLYAFTSAEKYKHFKL